PGSSHASLKVLGSNPALSGSPPPNDCVGTEQLSEISSSKPSNRSLCSVVTRLSWAAPASSTCTSAYLARSSSVPRALNGRASAEHDTRARIARRTLQRPHVERPPTDGHLELLFGAVQRSESVEQRLLLGRAKRRQDLLPPRMPLDAALDHLAPELDVRAV